MGYNTTVIVLNDALDMIRDDPKFGERLYYAVLELQRGEQVDIPAHSYRDGKPRGVHCNAATAVETHHADGTAVVAVGGNCASVLGHVFYTGYHGDESGKLKTLQQLAESMGYRLVKKPARKRAA
jgi:predicted Fe-Mo cluster-binding NifX family protein